ncbi:hypothetical protein CANCADRAFT_23273 [Tortispora caseinolytica NRRL Y-17796]|uniref:Probable electron transfer flavoprotein subunit alpha n=1 Tax=Tortispora caseinolytica NRRL Y-17796 TaxID=767744 RepID=A0A1E4TJF1_9ASCO|nr:hypothetical protein CANCADRAFT_23273 [Tortispora caseinolytica NRRL Y-17796]
MLSRIVFSRFATFQKTRLASTLAFLEHSSSQLTPGSLNTVTAASKLGGVTALLAGTGAREAATAAAQLAGVEKVLVAEDAAYDHGFAEKITPLVAANVAKHGFTHVVAPASSVGRGFIPRLGAALDVQPLSDIIGVESENTFVRPIYAGNIITTVKTSDKIVLLTARGTAFPPAQKGESTAPIEDAETADLSATPTVKFISEHLAKSERPDLGSATRVVSGGRALKDKESFDSLVYPLADALGAAVGASRAAVDAGYADNSLQVGQTGKVVAPELYIALGISGAIQHLAGMKDAKTIVCINKDPECPLFGLADFSLEGDIFQIVPELTEKIKNA